MTTADRGRRSRFAVRGRDSFPGTSRTTIAFTHLALVQVFGDSFSVIRLNIHEAKTHLSRYLDRLLKGETILLCKRNVPIAEIKALPPARTSRRAIGKYRGKLKVPASFFAPLPDDVLALFEGCGASVR